MKEMEKKNQKQQQQQQNIVEWRHILTASTTNQISFFSVHNRLSY